MTNGLNIKIYKPKPVFYVQYLLLLKCSFYDAIRHALHIDDGVNGVR